MTRTHFKLTLAIYVGLVLSSPPPFVGAKPTGGTTQSPGGYNLIEAKIEAFKEDILNRLGYDSVPDLSNVTSSIAEKRRMIQLYRKYIQEKQETSRVGLEEEEEDEEERLIHSRTFHILECKGAESSVSVDSRLPKAYRFYFNVHLKHPEDDANNEIHIHSAKFKVFKSRVLPQNLKDKFSVEQQVRVNVYQIVSLNSSGEGYRRKLLDSRQVDLSQATWETFEIASAVQNWLDDEESNLGLEVSSESQDIHDVITFDLKTADKYSSNTTVSTNPSVQLYSQERSILKRVKRRSRRRRDCTEGDGETRCCRYPIRISFREIGWDSWILAPSSYNGYYCSGTCPYRYKMANTFAGIKSLLHLKNPDSVPSPCCVATKLSSFTILHYDREGKYTFSDYPDLVVDQCKCG